MNNEEIIRKALSAAIDAGMLVVEGMDSRTREEVVTDVIKSVVTAGLAAVPNNISVKVGGIKVSLPVDLLLEMVTPAIFSAISALFSHAKFEPTSVDIKPTASTKIVWKLE